MSLFAITHPTAAISRTIENIVITGKNGNIAVRAGCAVVSRLMSLTLFPLVATAELLFKRIPRMIQTIGSDKFDAKADKVAKFALGILFTPLGGYVPESVTGFFLKRPKANEVRPFGVETQFGRTVDAVHYPKTAQEAQSLVLQAKRENRQVSIIGAGMSQGTQTVPNDAKHLVINTKYLNEIRVDERSVTVGSGATWEQLQLKLDAVDKSVIVKQASDLFSIGGSVGINCHGWAHEYGALSSTVEELEIIDADGNIKTLVPGDEQFGCMFGTLGYFGIVLKVKLKIVENEMLKEVTSEVGLDEFVTEYQNTIKDKNIPLFGGRLVLDSVADNPLRSVCMNRFEKDNSPLVDRNIKPELKKGSRIERIGLKLFAHLSNYSVKRLTEWFWKREKTAMFAGRSLTRNEALHPPINAFTMFRDSNLHTQWLQEYFIKPERLANFLRFLGSTLKANDVRLVNATIRPTPKDTISVLPYAEEDRFAVVISFSQDKSNGAIQKTKKWMESVNAYLAAEGGVFYQAYMPFATREQFEACYGPERVARMRELKQKYDPNNLFGNAHTAKYYEVK